MPERKKQTKAIPRSQSCLNRSKSVMVKFAACSRNVLVTGTRLKNILDRGSRHHRGRPLFRNGSKDCSRKDAKRRKRLTADSRRLSQMRIRTFHRRDAEYAEGRNFCPIGRQRLGKSLQLFLEQCFCLSSSPDKQKINSLRPLRLCGNFLKISLRAWRLGAKTIWRLRTSKL